MRSLGRIPSAVVVVMACASLAVGCSEDPADDVATDPTSGSPTASESAEESPSESPTESASENVSESVAPLPDWPACAQVWVDGARLPGNYKGCVEGTEAVKATTLPCEIGTTLVTYADQFWGVRTGTIHDAGQPPLKKNADYRDDVISCKG